MDGQEFCQAVLAHIPRATAAEREAIRQELLEHLADHQEALEAGGMDAAAAQERAVAAMGDAGEIGRQWNARLSPLWLWVGRVCKAVCILLMVVMFQSGANFLYRVVQNLDARWSDEPMDGWKESEALWSEKVDLCAPFGDQVIRFFRVSLVEAQDRAGDYCVELDVLAYAQNPLKPALDFNVLKNITCNGAASPLSGSTSSEGVCAVDIQYPIEPGTAEATFILSLHGETAAVTVPLNWEEVEGYVP